MSKKDHAQNRPKQIQVRIIPSLVKVNRRITNIKYEDDLKPDDIRQQDTVYLPQFPTEERDAALGFYLSKWELVEMALFEMLRSVLMISVFELRSITRAGLRSSDIIRLVRSRGEAVLDPSGFVVLETWLNRVKTASTSRNRIIHASWILDVQLGVNEQGFAYIAQHRWLRRYEPETLEDSKALEAQDPKAFKKYVRTISRLREDAANAQNLAESVPKISSDEEQRGSPTQKAGGGLVLKSPNQAPPEGQ